MPPVTMIDLRPHFKHLHWRPMRHSFGVPVASDWADKSFDDPVFGLYKNCGLWTMDEAQILHQYAVAAGGAWLDIGCHTFWTSAHIAAASQVTSVVAVDPMLRVPEFHERCQQNVEGLEGAAKIQPVVDCDHGTSNEFFAVIVDPPAGFSGVCIDGDHCAPHPLHDAQHAAAYLELDGVILLHDATGKPVQDAVMWLAANGFHCKVYLTPHVVVACAIGNVPLLDYTPDPRIAACVRPYLGEIARFV